MKESSKLKGFRSDGVNCNIILAVARNQARMLDQFLSIEVQVRSGTTSQATV
jgi:hypothetical protein